MSLREKWKNDKIRKRKRVMEKWIIASYEQFGYLHHDEKNPVFERRKMKKLEDAFDSVTFGDTPRVKIKKEIKVIII